MYIIRHADKFPKNNIIHLIGLDLINWIYKPRVVLTKHVV